MHQNIKCKKTFIREINVLRVMRNRCFQDWHSNRFVANQELERKDVKALNVKRSNPLRRARSSGLTYLVGRQADAQLSEKEE
jgi:hypothetical protein